ncbi:AMP-binding protein [Pontibacterium granulatum]|uniref:AMP-binding protein n=1 Tax=Pontibacterium granulatum TaxID=2036029 RepID=UPI00249C73E8|nr:AMP-binding protein [Pontibacterium granulatum]MDI3326562.1 AMP-binding protein [Pontibacterium granulatum]
MNIAEILRRADAAYTDQPAIVLGTQPYLTYRQLYRRVAVLAHHLREQFSLQPGDRVALVMENRPEYVEAMFAAWHAGLVVVPMNAKLHPSEFHYILQNSDAALCFTSNKLHQQLLDSAGTAKRTQLINVDSKQYLSLSEGEPLALEPKDSDDLAWLFYTSGTTGRPKGAMQSHRNLHAMLNGFLSQIKSVACGDAVYHGAPMSHGGGYYILPFIAKGGIQLIPPSGGFDVPELLSMLREQRSVSFFAAPTMVKRLVEYPDAQPADFENLDTIIYGGAPMYQTDLQRAHQVLGNKLVQIYGQGECPMNITVLDRYQHAESLNGLQLQRLASVGLPHFGIELKIVTADNAVADTGIAGEICVHGDAVMLGYWHNDQATSETLRDGWLYTGDIGYLDEQGFLYLTDRSKDVIISGGSNIYPREVEEVLLQHPDVREVSVIGIPDAEWGELVVAYVSPTPGTELNNDRLEQYCLEKMARFKRPKLYRFLDKLPKNSTGKILKTALRQHFDCTNKS